MAETLGEKIRRLRKAKGLRQADLAALVDVTTGTVIRWESGENGPNEQNARALGREFSQPWRGFFSEGLAASPSGKRLDRLEERLDRVEATLARLETRLGA